jgi:hypothetical protein
MSQMGAHASQPAYPTGNYTPGLTEILFQSPCKFGTKIQTIQIFRGNVYINIQPDQQSTLGKVDVSSLFWSVPNYLPITSYPLVNQSAPIVDNWWIWAGKRLEADTQRALIGRVPIPDQFPGRSHPSNPWK